jgi:type I restriction enzyme S subunit
MAGEWRRHQVSALIDEGGLIIGDGYRAKNEELASSGLPFARAGNINNGFQFEDADHFPETSLPRVGNKISEPGDVVFTSKGTVGRFAFVLPGTPRFVYSPQLCFWRSVDKALIDPRFLHFWMYGREFFVQFKGVAGQTDMAEYVSLTDQRRMHITLPPPNEQRAIAHILGTLDDKIQLNRRMSETLEAIVRALFKSWFMDFEPVRAKAEDRDPGLPAHIADLFPASFMNSEFGEIPEGWTVATLADHFEAVKGVSYKGSGLGDEGMPLHNLNSVYEGGGYKYEGIKYYSGDYAERHVVVPGDAIVANTEQGHDRLLIGYAAVVPEFFGDRGIASHHIYRLRPRPGSTLTATFLCWLLNSPPMHDVVSGYANGTTVNMLPIDGIQKPLIVRPPTTLVEMFDALAVNAERRREEMISESRTLDALRDELLPRLISGALRVKDAEKFVGRGV